MVGFATYFGDPTAPEQSDMAVGASAGTLFLALLIRGAGRRYLFGREQGERRTRLRQGSAVLLIVVGRGLGAAGMVESVGAATGTGVMLIVSGVFLLRWRKLVQ